MTVVDTQTLGAGVLSGEKKVVHESAVQYCPKLLWPKCGWLLSK